MHMRVCMCMCKVLLLLGISETDNPQVIGNEEYLYLVKAHHMAMQHAY